MCWTGICINRPQRQVGFGNNHPAVRGFARRNDDDDIPF